MRNPQCDGSELTHTLADGDLCMGWLSYGDGSAVQGDCT